MAYNRRGNSLGHLFSEDDFVRIFDLVGIFFVAAWAIVVGAFLIFGLDDRSRTISLTDGIIDLHEETLWMTAYREGDEVGILREDRTRLVDGWLIEIQGIVELEFMADIYSFRFSSRSTLNEDLTLRSAIADVEAFGMHLKMQGQYREGDGDQHPGFYLNVLLDDSTRQFVVDLDERPRLAGQAIPQMLASEELEEGVRFRQEFFDPLTLAPAEIELIYEGREEITNSYFTEGVLAHSFGQSVGNFHTRIYTDEFGTVIRQVMPMQVALARIPDALGQSSMATFGGRFDDLADKKPPFLSALDADDLLALVSRFGTGNTRRFRAVDAGDEIAFDDDEPDEPTTRQFRILELDRAGSLDLKSPRQHIAFQTSREARVETAVDNRLWHAGHAPINSDYKGSTDRAERPYLDSLISHLEELADDDELEGAALAGLTDEFCPDFAPGSWTPQQRWPQLLPEEITEPIHCLALFADALAALDMAPHFVHGVIASADQFLPHIWITLYRDGKYLGEFDPMSNGLPVAADHIQLYVDDSYRPDRLNDLVHQITPY